MYIYAFLDKTDKVIYIGKTKKTIEERINNHFSSAGHLPKELFLEFNSIKCIKCYSEFELTLKEIVYIGFYKPKYNIEFKNKDLVPKEYLEILLNDMYKWDVYITREKMKEKIAKKISLLDSPEEKWWYSLDKRDYEKILKAIEEGFVYTDNINKKVKKFRKNNKIFLILLLQSQLGLGLKEVLGIKKQHLIHDNGFKVYISSRSKTFETSEYIYKKLKQYCTEKEYTDNIFDIKTRNVQQQLKVVTEHLGINGVTTFSFRKYNDVLKTEKLLNKTRFYDDYSKKAYAVE